MKKSVVTLYSFLVVLSLIALCGWIGYSYYTGQAKSQTDFSEILPSLNNQVTELLKETEDPGSNRFKESMEEILKTRPEVKGLLIYAEDNRAFYIRLESKNNRLLEKQSNNETFLIDKINRDAYTPPLGIGHDSAPLTTIKGTDLKVSYLHETFSPIKIYQLLLTALYLISGLFVVTLLFLIILSMKEKSNGIDKNDDFFEPPTPDPSMAEDTSSDFSTDLEINNSDELTEADNLNLDDFNDDSFDLSLPNEESNDDFSLDNLDFNLDDEETSPLGDLALPDEEETDDFSDLADFELPTNEETSDFSDLADLDLPDDGETDDFSDLADFELPTKEETADFSDLGDLDLPDDENDDDFSDLADFELPTKEETADFSDLGDLDLPDEEDDDFSDLDNFDLPTEDETAELDDLGDFDLPSEEETSEMDDLGDFDLPSEEEITEDNSLDDGGDLFDDLEELGDLPEIDEEQKDLPDEEGDLLGDITDEDILGDTIMDIDDAEEIEDLPDLENFMAENILEGEDEKEESQIFSPRSDVCWEKVMQDRLPQELNRAASENEDLSFIYLRDNSVHNDEEYKAFSQILTKDFPYRDLIFEWGDQGFAMILPNSDLVETLEKLDVFVNEQPERDIRIGATSRNGRLLDQDLLIEEASSAIKRSSAENKIIGFRADPDRYRETIGKE
jgi:hypothetical protein